MNDKKIKRLFDFQKFEGNSAMAFAIQSARNYIKSVKSNAVELDESELDILNAAGIAERIGKKAKKIQKKLAFFEFCSYK